TTGNTTSANLASDVNTALASAKISGTGTTVNLSTKVMAEGVGSALRLKIIDAAISSVGLSAAIDNPAVFELGLSDEATITLPLIAAVKDVALVVGRVATDTTLNFAINGGASIPVTLYSDDTATNSTILSLVSDLNQALHVAAVKGGTIAGFAPAGVTFS